MEISLPNKARHLRRRLCSLTPAGGIVLLYHRVADCPSDPHSLCVSPQNFSEHLEVLRQQAHPSGLQKFADSLKTGQPIRRAVAITFDDGYADNLYFAKPLLERYEIPATVFLTSNHLGSDREFWWDELERIFLQPGNLPTTLELEIEGRLYRWSLNSAVTYSESQFQAFQYWRCGFPEKNDPTPRQRCYRALYRLLRRLSEEKKQTLMQTLRKWAGLDKSGRATHLPLTVGEVRKLIAQNLIEIGAHTQTHPVLSALPEARQRIEIQQSKIQLQEMLGVPIKSFAYPHGGIFDFTGRTMELVRECGFTSAFSACFDVVWRWHDLYRIPRISVGNVDGETFAKHLNWLLA